MTREFIINELVARGIEVSSTKITKNGVVMEGIIVGNGKIRPTIYPSHYENKNESEIDSLIEMIIDTLENAPVFDTNNLTNWEYVKTRLQLCIQQKGNENICKRDFLDLEQYVRVIVSESEGTTCKVNPEMLQVYGISEDELFSAAMKCTKENVVIEDMAKMVADMMGISIEEVLEMGGDNPPMVVITNKSKLHGASSICYMDILKEIADRYESDLVIIPSSIHECILYPVEDTTDFRTFNSMIQEVNAAQLAPEEVLGNHAYRFLRDKCKISYYTRK